MNDKFICRTGSLTPPGKNVNTRNKRCKQFCRGTMLGIVPRVRAIPHNSKCRYGERGAADAKPKAQIILDAVKVSAASGETANRSRGSGRRVRGAFVPRCTMRVPQPDIIEHFGNADAVPQPPERCLSRQAGIVRCCLRLCCIFHPELCRVLLRVEGNIYGFPTFPKKRFFPL